jgi:hypothetical protein
MCIQIIELVPDGFDAVGVAGCEFQKFDLLDGEEGFRHGMIQDFI